MDVQEYKPIPQPSKKEQLKEALSDQAPFLEVTCKSSSAIRRFAPGTEAGFAVSVINRRLKNGEAHALHVEAVKDGEEPICFGPNSILTDYGGGWKLQTVTEGDFPTAKRREEVETKSTRIPEAKRVEGSHSVTGKPKVLSTFQYFGRILMAFSLLFVLGAIFTLALENLPKLILLVDSYL